MSKPLKRSALEMIQAASAPVKMPDPAVESDPADVRPRRRNATKDHTKQLTLYLADPVYRQLREIAFAEDTKMHPLILEALDMLFKSRSRPQIAHKDRVAGQPKG